MSDKRAGLTEVTSISLSKEFKDLIDDYNISPTEAIRKGIAVELCERGIAPFLTEKNKKRIELMKDLIKTWNEIEKNVESKILKKLSECKNEIEKAMEILIVK